MKENVLRVSDFELLGRAAAELATMLEMHLSIDDMATSNPEAVATVTETCWRLHELQMAVPEEVTHLVSRLAHRANSIRFLLKTLKLTRPKVAKAAGIDISLLRQIEEGKREPSPEIILALSLAFRRRTDQIFQNLVPWERAMLLKA